MSSDGWVELSFDSIVRETELAIQLQMDEETQVWFPRSVIETLELNRDGSGTVIVRTWFAMQKGLV